MMAAMFVAGRRIDGTQRRRMTSWKNSDMACWTVVIVFALVRSSPPSAPWSRTAHKGSEWGVSAQDLLRL